MAGRIQKAGLPIHFSVFRFRAGFGQLQTKEEIYKEQCFYWWATSFWVLIMYMGEDRKARQEMCTILNIGVIIGKINLFMKVNRYNLLII